jgi:CRP/FNR family transcriptional regulator, anaerobic regulatory protein
MQGIDKIKKAIGSIVFLNEEEWLILFDFIEIQTLKKNTNLLNEGEVCDSIAYVDSGLLIYYKSLENGKEITTDFAFEGDWVTNNQSRLDQSPSLINIKTLEDAELVMIKNKDLPDILERLPKLEKLVRILMEGAFIKISQHSIDLQVFSAKERYIQLLQKHPEVFQKVPQYHIANYLGIAPKSLSRLRNEILNKH